MAAYCERSLTSETDALHAFRGHLARCGLASYWGVPAFRCQPKTEHVDHLNAGFAHGLAWRAHRDDVRSIEPNSLFPTWAWVSRRPGIKQYDFYKAYKASNGKRLATDLSFYPANLVAFAQFSISRASDLYEPLFSESKIVSETFESLPLFEWDKKLRIRTIRGEIIPGSLQKGYTSGLNIFADDGGIIEWTMTEDGERILHLLLLIREKGELERAAPSAWDKLQGRSIRGTTIALGAAFWMIVKRINDSTCTRVGILREKKSAPVVRDMGIVEWDVE